MEKDLKNEAQKMISSTSADQKEVSGGDDVTMNQGGANMEEDHQRESGDDTALSDDAAMNEGDTGSGDDVALNDDATMNEGGTGSDFSTSDDAVMEEDHQNEGGDEDITLSDSSTTDKKEVIGADDATMNEAGSKLLLSDSSRLLLASSINLTPNNRKFEWVPAQTETSSGKLYIINLNYGEDVVDAIYRLSEAFDHRRLVSIVSASGSVSDVLFRDHDGSHARTGVFEITSLSLSCPADEDGRPSRNKAACSVLLTDDNGKTFESTGVNSLISDGPIEITAELEKEKSAGESSDAAAQDGNSDSIKAIEELEAFPTNFPAADGNINPTTTTTGAANDQDKKSPSEEDV